MKKEILFTHIDIYESTHMWKKNSFTWSLLVAMKNMAFFSTIPNQKKGPRSVKFLSLPTLKSAMLMVK